MIDGTRHFLAALARRQAAALALRGVAAVVQALALALLAATALVAADYFVSFDPAALTVLGRGTALAVAVVLLVLVACALRGSRRDMARLVDARLGDPRRPVLTALELGRQAPRGKAEAFLAGLAIEHAAGRLAALPATATLPLRLLLRRAVLLLAAAAVAAAPVLLHPAATVQIVSRYRNPQADLPPYSRLQFRLDPARPVVVYGDDVELAVTVGGAPARAGVELLTRAAGAVQRTPCFSEGGGRYGQRLERVTAPVDFCFASGRARSRWHRVEVNLEPRIALARVAVAPPAYSRLPPRLFTAGEAPLRELRGARVRLDVTSNRPLKGGQLALRTAAEPKAARTVAGRTAGRHVVRFEWELAEDATLEVVVADVQGTPLRTPYRLKQRVLPDERPRVQITEPGLYSMATPRARVRLAGHAEDDLGLRQVELVRGLGQFNDRVARLGPPAGQTRLDFARELDLGALGVLPGQSLEFFAEAQDTNPDRCGRTGSEVARVEIISDEEYARVLRERLDAEQFMQRFRLASRALRDVRDAAQKLEDAAAGQTREAELAAARDALRQAAAGAAEQLRQLATDVPIYDMDRDSQATFARLARTLAAVPPMLGLAGTDRARLRHAVDELRKGLEPDERELADLTAKAKYVTDVARVLELARTFRAVLAAQEELARRFRRYSDPGRIPDPSFLRHVGERQQAIRLSVERLRDDLRERAAALPDDPALANLRASAQRFAEGFDALEIPPAMQAAERSAAAGDGRATRDAADRALALLRELLERKEEPDEFRQACRRQTLRFGIADALQAMLDQLGQCRNPGAAPGMEGGAGDGFGMGAGDSADGYAAGANTPLNVPLLGTPRVVTGTAQGSGPDAGTPASGRVPVVAREGTAERGLTSQPATGEARGTLRLEEAPEKYRDALKVYFGAMEDRR